MDLMQRLAILLVSSCAFLGGSNLGAADLSAVRTVYVMPMARGLDQYLAGRLTSRGLFQVVTDPKLADAVLTDRVGETLQTELEAIFPTPKPETEEDEDAEPAAKPESKPDTKAEKAKAAKDQLDANSPISAFGNISKADGGPPPTSSFGRSKGNIFLVDAKSRQVVWSTYDPPRTNAPHDLNRTASDIVSRIRKDLKAKQK
jgi:hypothetical protein